MQSSFTNTATDYRTLTNSFMDRLKVGDKFKVNENNYFVKCVGTWKSDSFQKKYKTLTVKCEEKKELIKFFYFFGYEGNPSSQSRTASVKQHRFVRDVEG